MGNVNDSFFDGYYKDIWKMVIPDDLTRKEIAFMIPYFGLNAGTPVLDLMCGHGRHALALGRNGIPVTAVDNLADYISEIGQAVAAEQLPVQPVHAGVLDYQPEPVHDLVLCMGNSFNFFTPEEASRLLLMIHAALKPGGKFLLNSWSLAETAYPRFTPESAGKMGTMELRTQNKFCFDPTRIETHSTIISPEGETEEKDAVDYIYTLSEMKTLFRQAGLDLTEAWSIPGRKAFSLGEPRAYLIGVKH